MYQSKVHEQAAPAFGNLSDKSPVQGLFLHGQATSTCTSKQTSMQQVFWQHFSGVLEGRSLTADSIAPGFTHPFLTQSMESTTKTNVQCFAICFCLVS